MGTSLGFRAFLYMSAAILLLPPESFAHEGMQALAVSHLTAIPLDAAHSIIEPSLREPIVAQLHRLARDLGRSCEESEVLVWTGDAYKRATAKGRIDTVVESLGKAGYATRLQDGGRNADSDLTVITAVRQEEGGKTVTIAGVFAAGDEALLLGWCRLGTMADTGPGSISRRVNRFALALNRLTQQPPGEATLTLMDHVLRARKAVAQGQLR